MIKQLRRVEEAISGLAVFPGQREAPLDRPHKPRRPRADRGQVSVPDEPLTAREVCVLQHLCRKQTLREIAQELYVSRNTIKSHTNAVYRKLRATGRSDAIRRGQDLGILVLVDRLLLNELLVTGAVFPSRPGAKLSLSWTDQTGRACG